MTPIGATGSIDVSGIVSQLMQIERRPLQALETSLSGLETQLSAYGRLQAALASFQDAARALGQADTWNAVKASTSDESTVRATASAGAMAGNHTIEVAALAGRQTLASTAWAGADSVIGGGTLRIQFGTLDAAGTGFSADPDRPETAITIPSGATLAELRTAINAAAAGITATLVADGGGQRLMLRSAQTGETQAFRILADDLDGGTTDVAGLSALAFDPAAPEGGGRNLALAESARAASLSVNGLPISAEQNLLAETIENLTLELRAPTTGPVDVSLATDREALRERIDNFVKAYNDLSRLISEQTRYDEASRTAGPLQGNQIVNRIQQKLREILRETVGSGTLDSLNAAGIRLQRDGSLAMDESRIEATLANPKGLRALFASAAGDPGGPGIALRVVEILGQTLGADGAIATANESLRAREKAILDQQGRLESRLGDVERRLLRQYTALDASLSQMTSSLASIQTLLKSTESQA
ncbi:MAG: hypothetical protein ABS55_00420 [Lautropia sp. SCN 70-15]|nr:MAG: hypothetical protein ABS55_00420 [Lautropia sp. SCN 70-15]